MKFIGVLKLFASVVEGTWALPSDFFLELGLYSQIELRGHLPSTNWTFALLDKKQFEALNTKIVLAAKFSRLNHNLEANTAI